MPNIALVDDKKQKNNKMFLNILNDLLVAPYCHHKTNKNNTGE